ncbi:hypothetical protein CEXT_173221 [Caerostris extrusa]|uniref:Uncharacterized protein n=1 Tax=Caerostris extrusa TaxID=172846 RepID=A0AAV4P4W8_CAEEX|nr:hypothetical protein CEXT_173221 [Caerostris extrusa]
MDCSKRISRNYGSYFTADVSKVYVTETQNEDSNGESEQMLQGCGQITVSRELFEEGLRLRLKHSNSIAILPILPRNKNAQL